MKDLLDLETFVKVLTDKEYDGYFTTEGCCAGRLENSINAFLQVWAQGNAAPLKAGYLHLSTYLEWNGENKPKVECNMWVRYENEKFDLQHTEMYIRRTDGFGQLLKQTKLTSLDTSTIPTVKQAVALVSDTTQQKLYYSGRRF